MQRGRYGDGFTNCASTTSMKKSVARLLRLQIMPCLGSDKQRRRGNNDPGVARRKQE
ncbi:hypothetical protein EV128_12398 [Rhizobium azibense]|nr:hypothetical protein EV128_12398 [Rhizobium azibense]